MRPFLRSPRPVLLALIALLLPALAQEVPTPQSSVPGFLCTRRPFSVPASGGST